MKHLLIAVLLIPLPAFAGSISVSIDGVGETWTLSDADQARFEHWVLDNYKCASPPPTIMQRPNPALATPTPPKNCAETLSLADAKTAWVEAILQGTLGNVIRGNLQPGSITKLDEPIIPVSKTKMK